jgi:O-antigen/teichoic acid export membrane protein
MFLIAPQFCELFFGEGFAPAGKVLRVMLPTAVVLLPSYICGFPMLSSMGLAEHANYSTVFGSVIHLVNLAILHFTGNMNMITLGAAMSVAEILILCYRLAVIWRHRDLLRKGE